MVELVDRAEWIGLPAVVIGELLLGFRRGSQHERNVRELDELIESPVISILPVDRDVAGIYAQIVIELHAAGTPVPTNDVWIAATAARAGATIFSYDAHFDAIRRVGSIVLQAQ